jgi:sugar transferase (PEP-CTERM/EpsH1 system associated)
LVTVGDLLFLCHRIPYPPNKGEKIRAWHILDHLSKTHQVHLGCFIDDPADWEHVPLLKGLCADAACFGLSRRFNKLKALIRFRPGRPLTLDYFYDARLRRWVNLKLAGGQISHVFVYCSAMAEYVMSSATIDGPVRVLDMIDIDSEKWTAYASKSSWPARVIWAREGRTLLAFERRAVMHFDHTLFVSEPECRRFAALAPESRNRISWLENGVDLERYTPALPFDSPFSDDAAHVVFVGTMDYWPNADAVTWFVNEVMPIVRRQHSSVRFHIVGANPGPEVRRLAEQPGVHVTGRVGDVRPYLAHATLVVAPLRLARGIQNKVLEAMAMARPVVATSQAFEGIRAIPGRDLLVADDAEAMARMIGEVVVGHHPGLGAAAREVISNSYAWPVTLRGLDDVLEKPEK